MVVQKDIGVDINSDTIISLTTGDNDNESDNHSVLSDDDDNKDSHSLQISNNILPSNSSVNVENSSDVIVGPVANYHGPVTIYQNIHNNAPAISDKSTYLSDESFEENSVSSEFSSAKLVPESLSGYSTETIPIAINKITIFSLVVFVLIVLLTIVGTYVYYENNRDVSSSSNDLTEIKNIVDKPSNDLNEIKSTVDQLQIDGSRHKMIYRDRWGGRPPLRERPQKLPVKYVIISHTAGQECNSITTCSKKMTHAQSLHVNAGSSDIGYNFLIGGDANIYVGRGWDKHNFHMKLDTVGICFIGNYVYSELTSGMIEATQQLHKQGVKEGKLAKDYILVAHNQTYDTQSPGKNVYKQIKFWPHFSPDILEDIEK